MRKTPLYNLITWVILFVGLAFLGMLAPILYSPEFILSDDFGHFWASGKLFIEHKNPYDLELLLSTQAEIGAAFSSETGIRPQTLNPPWVLLIFAPFSLLNYSLARVAWLLINIILIVISVRIFWNLLPGSTNKFWLALLVAFSFTPTYSVLSKGQITPWILFGIAGFLLYTEGKISVWWAGIGLVIISTKPQLFYLLWIILALWVITKHKWQILVSTLCITGAAFLITWLISNQVFSQYITAIQDYPYDQWATPTISSYLRFFWLGVDKFWVQFIPLCLGIGWSIIYFLRHGNLWNWCDQMPVLTLGSLLTSPYAWTYDAIIILPAILTATNRLSDASNIIKVIMWVIYILINLANILLHTRLSDFWFLWLVPTFAVWYLVVTLLFNQRAKMTT